MTNKPTKKPVGRPLREFDQKTFEGLCSIWCTWAEMENILQCNRNTLDKWCQRTYGSSFEEVYNRFADTGKASLRRAQFQLSKKNSSMGIWLGKQKLGQRDDPQEIEQFNGKLVSLLEKLQALDTQKDSNDKNKS